MSFVHRFFLTAAILVAPDAVPADSQLPASLISIPESVESLFVAETSAAKLHRFERSGDEIIHSGSYYMSIGQNGSGKERSGDKRTPLGVYFVTEQLDTSRLHEKYGATAFPLDYPNAWDRRANRSGDGIWVHGVDPRGGPRPERDTDGCIALSNEDLRALAPIFKDNVTPVVVTREVNWVDSAEIEALRFELESRVTEWASSKERGDLHSYLSLYDDDFARWGMDKTEWSSFIVQTASRDDEQPVRFRQLLLLGYPEENGVYLSRFQLEAGEKLRETVSTTRLYWRRDSGGTLKIIAEDEG